MHSWRNPLCLFLLFAVPAFLCAQVRPSSVDSAPYIFRHIDHTDGLLSNEVHALAQDNQGYMWIGTAKGLQRYDGLRFVYFADTAAGPVTSTVIYYLQPDSGGQRLLFNQSSAHIGEWRFLKNSASTLLPASVFDTRKAVTYTDAGHPRWAVQLYLTRKTSPDGTISHGIALVQAPGSATPEFAQFISNDALQQLWIVHGDELLLFNTRTKMQCSKATGFDNNALLQLINRTPSIMRSISMDSRGNLWMIGWSTLIYRYQTPTNKLHVYSLDNIAPKGTDVTNPKWASTLLEDNHGQIWIGTAGAGLLAYNEMSDDFSSFRHEAGNDLSIRYNYQVSSIFQDREENIWIGTDRGINIFNPYRTYFSSLGNPSPAGKFVPASEINDVIPWRHGKLLVATWGSGIFICDQQLKVERTIFFAGNQHMNQAWCFLEDDDGNMLAGCQYGILHILNKAGEVVRTSRPAAFENKTIRCMQKDSRGNILFGLHNGKIVIWDKQSKQFLPPATIQQSPSIALSTVICLSVAGEEAWAGTISGLARFDLRSRCFTGMYKPQQRGLNTCYSVAVYNDSLLLAGFENDGLYFFNKKTTVFQKIVVDYDQPLWSAHSISVDGEGNIWFTTEYDVCKYEPGTGQFHAWHPEKGLLHSPFGRLTRLPSGDWLTYTHTEVVRFSLPAIGKPPTSPVTITGLQVFDKPVFIDSLLYYHQPLRLSYDQNFLTIAYSSLRFSGTTNVAFYYRLIGVDKNWVPAREKGDADYTNLPPGQYRFEVRTGEPNAAAADAWIDIYILAPFWQTTWFRILSGVLIAALVYTFLSWRFRAMRSEAAMKEQIAKTEMMALRAQMNPHFIFNCINGIDALILSDDKYQATIYLNKFAMLIRHILESSKQNTISVARDLDTLKLYIELEQWRHENKFQAEIVTDEAVFEEDYKVPPLVVQPYVENAILHGLRHRTDNKGKLTISIYKRHDALIYIIEDNGVGRPTASEDKQHRSYGMEINLGRLQLFNKRPDMPVQVTDLTENGRATGTRVEIRLNIQ